METVEKLWSFSEIDIGESPVALDWSACGRWLAVINVNSSVTVVDTVSETALKSWIAHDDGALALTWHPKLPLFATSCQGGIVKFWHLENDQTINKQSELVIDSTAGNGWVELLKWSPDGQHLAIGADNSVLLSSIKGELEASFSFEGGTVAAMDWHPKGSLLGVAGYGGVSIHNAQDPTEKPILLKRKGSLLSLSWSPDGKYILAGCQDNAVALWRFRTQQNAQMSGFDYKPLQLTWLNRGKKLITGGTKELVIWPFDKKGPEGRSPETRSFHEHAICAIATTLNGQIIASGCRSGRIAIWSSKRDSEPLCWIELDSRVEHLHWSPDKKSKTLAASSRQGHLTLYDVSEIIQ